MPVPLRPFRFARAFTLAEATLSIAITSILLLGMGGALLMTMSAADGGADSSAAAIVASERLLQVNAELSVATSITQLDSGAIRMRVPDRDGDGQAETIEYTWEGKPGDPIMRSYNGATPTRFIVDVQSNVVAAAVRPAPTPVESAERTIMECDSPSGAGSAACTVTDKDFWGQYVRPTLPAEAESWTLKRVSLWLSRSKNDGTMLRLSVHAADSSLRPTGPALASVLFSSGSVGVSGAWVEYTLGPVAGLRPGKGVCIMVEGITGGEVRLGSVSGGTEMPFNTHRLHVVSGAWDPPSDDADLRFRITGTVTTLVEP